MVLVEGQQAAASPPSATRPVPVRNVRLPNRAASSRATATSIARAVGRVEEALYRWASFSRSGFTR
jgi:hypothetical protein